MIAKQIAEAFGRRPLVSVRPSEVQAWAAELSRTQSAATACHSLGVMRRVFDYFVGDGVIQRNPAAGIRLSKVQGNDPRPLRHEELWRLARAVGRSQGLYWRGRQADDVPESFGRRDVLTCFDAGSRLRRWRLFVRSLRRSATDMGVRRGPTLPQVRNTLCPRRVVLLIGGRVHGKPLDHPDPCRRCGSRYSASFTQRDYLNSAVP